MISSGLLLMYGIGAIVGPFIAPGIMALVGPGGLYLFAAGIHLLFFGYIIVRFILRPTMPDDAQGHFSEALASTQTASSILEEEQ